MPYPMTPPRIRRFVRNIVYRRRGRTAARVSKIMRQIGAPSMIHTFARPANRLAITANGTQLNLEGGTAFSPTVNGLNGGIGAAGLISNTLQAGFSQTFQFGFLTTPGDLAGLYDNFRIKSVKLRFDLSYNSAPGQSGGLGPLTGNALPILHYAIDPDDNTAPGGVSDVLQYSQSRSVRLGDKPLFINFTPRAQGVVSQSSGAIAVGNMLPTNTWMDTQNALTVPHFGVKYWIENLPVGNVGAPGTPCNWVLTCTPVYVLQCKNIH